jgi:hypothetical protein
MSRLWSSVVDRQPAARSVVNDRRVIPAGTGARMSVRQSQERVLDDLWQGGVNPVLAARHLVHA